MNRRHIFKALQIARRTRINSDLWRYGSNKFRSLRLRRSHSTEVAFPSNVMIELGNHCNLHCITCAREYGYGKQMDKGYMPLEKACAIVDELYPYLDSVGLTGMGETFLYPDLTAIASYIKAKKKSIVTSLSTNANIPRFMEKAEAAIPYLDTIQISTDGLGGVYETVRKNASFATLENNLQQLVPLAKKYKVDLMLNMVITRENYHQMADMVEFACQLHIPYLNFTYFNLACVTNTDRNYYTLYQSPEFLESLRQVRKCNRKFPQVYVTGLDFPGSPSFQKCPFPWSHFYITWDGYVVPCCAKPFPKELHFGNVFSEGVMGVLNSKSYQSFRRMWQSNHTPSFCEKCHFVEL